ncbi:glycoside hydrolase family 2, partial [Acinetobacter baumannii]
LKRASWQNWNGLWKYAITPASEQNIPSSFQGDILVPYPVESALSGVGKTVGKDQVLWYSTNIALSRPSGNNQVMLHFGAVDWQCD